MFPQRLVPKLRPHPLEPVITSFFLITHSAGTYAVRGRAVSPARTRVDMINSEFINVIRFSAVNTS